MDKDALLSRLKSLTGTGVQAAAVPAPVRISAPFVIDPLALIPAAPVSVDGGLTWTLPRGSLWIRADLMTAGAPPGTFAGLTIASGTLTLQQPAAVANGTLPSNGNFTVEAIPEATVLAGGPAEGPGADARLSTFSPPARCAWHFANGRVVNVDADAMQARVFGNEPVLTQSDHAFQWEGTFARVQLPFTAAPGRLEPVSQSANYTLDGSAEIERSGWALSIADEVQAVSGAADGAGRAAIFVGRGLRLTWPALRNGPLALGKTAIHVNSNDVLLIGLDVAPSRARHWVRLWFEERRAPEDGSALEARFDRTFTLVLTSLRKGMEAFVTAATLIGHTDRPQTAEGARFVFDAPGTFSIVWDSTGVRANADATAPNADRVSFALENALLTTQAPQSLALSALLDAAGDSVSGRLTTTFALARVLPMLPDPYAGNFDVRESNNPPLQLRAMVEWPEPAAPELKLNVEGHVTSLLPPPLDEVVPSPQVERKQRHEVAGDLARPQTTHWLLDISSRADQLGVAFGDSLADTPAATRIDGMALATMGNYLSVFTLPAVQWEAVEDPEAGKLSSADDGGPSGISVQSVKLVPLAPVDASQELVRAYATDKDDAIVSFSLPFGIRARADLNHFSPVAPVPLPVPNLGFNRPFFEAYEGGIQFKLRGVESTMRGFVRQLDNIPRGANPPVSVLDFIAEDGSAKNVSAIFNARFTTEVPLERLDLSGYGESCFSNWRNPNIVPPDVSHVRFDVLAGRTSHEVVQVVSYLHPCKAVLVRTITLERKGNAAVVRHKSAWVATTPGTYQLTGTPPFHRGAVRGYFNIREIRDTTVVVNLVDGGQVQAVYFDADVSVEGATRGARDAVIDGQQHRLVECRRQLGFVQLLPIKKHLSAPQLANLFAQKGVIGGGFDCELGVGGGSQKLHIAGLYADTAPKPGGGDPEFAVAVHGAPLFPQSGQWSAVRIRQTGANSPETTAVDARTGVPLVKEETATGPYRIDDPSNLLLKSAASTYGFLFGNDASRVVFPRPRVAPGALGAYETDGPKLADPAAMASGLGLFPKTNLVTLPPKPLDLSGAPQVLPEISSNANREFDLVNTPLFRIHSRSSGTPFTVRIDNNGWKVGSGRQELVVDLLGFKDIMRVRGELNTDAAGVRRMDNPRVDFGSALDPVQDLIDLLRKLDLPFGLKLAVRTGADSLHVNISTEFHLARPDGSRIDIGVGKLNGLLRVDVGVEASLSHGVQGNAILEISGDYQQSILGPLLYAGGYFRFRVGVDTGGKTQFELATGTIASIGGDLIPGLIELEATLKYAYRMIFPRPGAIDKIRPGLLVGMGARAKLLSGMVGISFDWEGQAVVERDGNDLVTTLDIRVAATVTVAWAFDEDVEVRAHFVTRVPFLIAAGLTAAVTGVGPVVL